MTHILSDLNTIQISNRIAVKTCLSVGALLSFQILSDRPGTIQSRRCLPSPLKVDRANSGQTAAVTTATQQQCDISGEHQSASASWSLSVLLSPSALSPELLVRCLGLLLCEAKLIVLGAYLFSWINSNV